MSGEDGTVGRLGLMSDDNRCVRCDHPARDHGSRKCVWDTCSCTTHVQEVISYTCHYCHKIFNEKPCRRFEGLRSPDIMACAACMEHIWYNEEYEPDEEAAD